MNKSLKPIILIAILFLVMGITSTASATDVTWTPDEFLNYIDNGTDYSGYNITISEGICNVTGYKTIGTRNPEPSNNISIRANGTVIFDGTSSPIGCFQIIGFNVTIQGITFINFNNTDDIDGGGVIKWIGDSDFGINNAVIQNCNFINNTVSLYGGAIYFKDYINTTIINCNFTNNTAYVGGAISYNTLVGRDISTFVNIEYCIFKNNCASDGCGAIDWSSYSYSSLNNFSMKYCNFTNNKAGRNYGAVCIYIYGYVDVDYCVFTNNKATLHDLLGTSIAIHDAIYAHVDYCNFSNNVGIIPDIVISDYFDEGRAIVSNCNFNNSKGGEHGSLALESISNSIVLNCNFTNCSGNKSGAISLLDINENYFHNCTLLNNNFINCSSNYGVAIYNQCSNLTVSGGNGALIYNDGKGTILSPVNVTLLNNGTVGVANGSTFRLSAILKTGNYTIIGKNFNFTVDGNPIEGNISNDKYTTNYFVNGNIGDRISVSGSYDSASNITYKNAILIIKNPANITAEDVTVSYAQPIAVNFNLTSKGSKITIGNVYVIIDGVKYYGNLSTGIINLPAMSADIYNLTIFYEENEEYVSANSSFILNITKVNPSFNISNITYGNDTLIITMNATVTGNITVTVNDKNQTIPIKNGKAEFNTGDLPAGDYNAKIDYIGDKNYNNISITLKFKVEKADTNLTISIKTNNTDALIYLNLTDKVGNPISGIVEVNITSDNGYIKLENVTVINGTYNLILNKLDNGKYNVIANFIATTNYTSSFAKNSFIINFTISYHLNATNVDKYYLNATQYHVSLIDNLGTPVIGQNVTVTLYKGGWASPVSYNITTNESGIATLKINLYAGFYIITATYDNATPVNNNITVRPVTYILTANDVIKYYKNGTNYTVKVTDQSGNVIANETVIVKVYSEKWLKSVEYAIKTNSSGIAVLPINLLPGLYSITATFSKTTKYNNIAVFSTLTANNLVKKVNQPAKLTARLVDGEGNSVEGKEVTFTVKVKEYIVTTDGEGIATLPINLGVGTWYFLIASDNVQTRATVKVIK